VQLSPDRLKITVEVGGVPWNTSTPASFVSLHFDIQFTLQAGGFVTYSDNNVTSIAFNTSRRMVEFVFEKCYLIDGVPFCGNQIFTTPPTTFGPFDFNLLFSLPVGVDFCNHNFGHWDNAIYDPQLTSLYFQSQSNPATPDSPTARSIRRNWVIPVAVVVSIIVVVIITVVLAAIFIPSVKTFFRPFSARGSAKASSSYAQKPTSTSKHADGWQTGAKPLTS
jgi:hypothetical protein